MFSYITSRDRRLALKLDLKLFFLNVYHFESHNPKNEKIAISKDAHNVLKSSFFSSEECRDGLRRTTVIIVKNYVGFSIRGQCTPGKVVRALDPWEKG